MIDPLCGMLWRMQELTSTQRIAANVRAEATRRGVTGQMIAEHLELTQPAVSRRMRGHVEFSASELHKLAGLLGVSVDDLHVEVSA